jgi:hypothetical protein
MPRVRAPAAGTPSVSDRDLDAEFARIIAGWDDEAPDPQRQDRDRDRDSSAVPTDRVTEPAVPADPTAPTAPTDRDAPSVSEDPTAPPEPTREQGPPSPTSPPTPAGASGLLELPIAPTTSHAWRASTPRRDDADDVLDGGDHFVPPSEIDLPSAETDPMFWAIVGGLVGGPLLLLYVLFFDREGSGWWVVTALTMVVVGFVLLVLRGGTERDPMDDGTRV